MSQPVSPVAAPRCRELRLTVEGEEVAELRARLSAACAALGLLLEGYHAMNVNWLASLPVWLEEHVVPNLRQTDMRKACGALALADQLRAATDKALLALELSWPHLKHFDEPQADPSVFVHRPQP